MMRIYEQYEVVNFKPAEVAVFIRNGWQLSPGMTGKLCPFFPVMSKPIHVIKLLLLLQRTEFRYDFVFAENAKLIASALIAKSDYQSAIKYLLRENKLLIDDESAVEFLQSFYENDAEFEGNKLLSALSSRFRNYIHEKIEKGDGLISFEPFIHRISALTVSSISEENDGIMEAMGILQYLKKLANAEEENDNIESSNSIHHIREVAASWSNGYMLRAFNHYINVEKLSKNKSKKINEKWTRLRALTILQHSERNRYSGKIIDKTQAFYDAITDLEWLVENIGYTAHPSTLKILIRSLIKHSKRTDLVSDLIREYEAFGFNLSSTLRENNGVDLNYQLVHSLYFNNVLSGYNSNAHSLNLPSLHLRRREWEEYYIELFKQLGVLEGVLIRAQFEGRVESSMFIDIMAILNATELSLMERVNWDRSYLLPEALLPILYDKISHLWCTYFKSSIHIFVKHFSEGADHQLGLYTEGFRNSMSAIIKNLIKSKMPVTVTSRTIMLLEKHVLCHVQNRWERTPELLQIVEYYGLIQNIEKANLVYNDMLKTSMGPSWYKESQLNLINTTMRIECDDMILQKYTSRFASLLDHASGEMTFQRYIRYAKERFIGNFVSKGRLDIGVEYLKFETLPPFNVLTENSEKNKVDSLSLGYGNEQGARNITIQSGVLEILRNIDGLDPFIEVALCNIFTLNDDVSRYVDCFSKQMSISLNKIEEYNHRKEVFPLIHQLLRDGKMQDEKSKYVGYLSEYLKPSIYDEFCNYNDSLQVGVKLPRKDKHNRPLSHSELKFKDDVFFHVNKRFEEDLSKSSKMEWISQALAVFKEENISIWNDNWSTSSNDLKESLKELFFTPEDAIKSLSDFISEYGDDSWTVVDKLLWFFQNSTTSEQAAEIFDSIERHFSLLICPDEFVFKKYNWIHIFESDKNPNHLVISLIAWLTCHPLCWISSSAKSSLIFLVQNIPEQTIPILLEEAALNEPSNKGFNCSQILLKSVKESPEIFITVFSNRTELVECIAGIRHLSIFKVFMDIGAELSTIGWEALYNRLESILPDFIDGSSEVALDEPSLNLIRGQIDTLNEMKILNREFCEEILEIIAEYCGSLSWKEVLKSDKYLKRSYYEEKNYVGRYFQLLKYTLNRAIMTRVAKNNIDELFLAINQT